MSIVEEISMPATARVVDFRDIEARMKLTGTRSPERIGSKGGIVGRPISSVEKKQIRQRARRKQRIAEVDLEMLYDGYPISEWDAEELARGRPRAKDGSFKGATPKWINRAVHEQIVKRFEEIVREEMNGHTVDALKLIGKILNDESTDDKNKPNTSASTKLDAAKFLIEHVVGKPKQRMETDISVKLQAVLGASMVNPTAGGGVALAQGYIEAKSWEDDDDLDTGE